MLIVIELPVCVGNEKFILLGVVSVVAGWVTTGVGLLIFSVSDVSAIVSFPSVSLRIFTV